jgi:hypothetical protein
VQSRFRYNTCVGESNRFAKERSFTMQPVRIATMRDLIKERAREVRTLKIYTSLSLCDALTCASFS